MNSTAPPLPTGVCLLGRRLGRYELVGQLARGGMGTVYLARHVGEARFQRLFAIKVLHPHLAREGACVDMLLDEARIAARLHHPNAVAVVDLGSDEDLHYVVLDYVEGVPFSAMIQHRSEPGFVEVAVSVVMDALEGLHAAHTLADDDGNALQLVHRDVSPQNILVGTDGVGRITDFGIAKAEARIVCTRPGTRKGKLGFMAPEQITDQGSIDRRADIWATGVVLWTALTGKHLFRTPDDAETMQRVLHKLIQPPSAVAPDVPACFDAVVLGALHRDIEARYGSALEMADALRAAASMHGSSCSRRTVGKWVSERFDERLGAQREAVRAASRALARESASESRVRAALPSVGSQWTDVGGSLSSPGARAPAVGAAHTVQYGSFAPVHLARPRDTPRSKTGLGVSAGVLGGLLTAALFYLQAAGTAGPAHAGPLRPLGPLIARVAAAASERVTLAPGPRARTAPEQRRAFTASAPERAARNAVGPARRQLAARTTGPGQSRAPLSMPDSARAPASDPPQTEGGAVREGAGHSFEVNPYVRTRSNR